MGFVLGLRNVWELSSDVESSGLICGKEEEGVRDPLRTTAATCQLTSAIVGLAKVCSSSSRASSAFSGVYPPPRETVPILGLAIGCGVIKGHC